MPQINLGIRAGRTYMFSNRENPSPSATIGQRQLCPSRSHQHRPSPHRRHSQYSYVASSARLVIIVLVLEGVWRPRCVRLRRVLDILPRLQKQRKSRKIICNCKEDRPQKRPRASSQRSRRSPLPNCCCPRPTSPSPSSDISIRARMQRISTPGPLRPERNKSAVMIGALQPK